MTHPLYQTAIRHGLSLVGLNEEKRPLVKRWQLTPALREREDHAEEFARLMSHPDVGIVLRMSGLIGIESDCAADSAVARDLVRELGLRPVRVEKREHSADGEKLHLYFREPHLLELEEDVSIRIEHGRWTGDITRQFRTWSRPTSEYQVPFEDWDAPRMHEGQYRILCERLAERERGQLEHLRRENGGALTAGRRDTVFSFSCLLFRFTADDRAVVELAQELAEQKFGPDFPGGRRELERQVRGALKKVRESEGRLGREWLDRPQTPRMLADYVSYLRDALRQRWTEDGDLIRNALTACVESLDLDDEFVREAKTYV